MSKEIFYSSADLHLHTTASDSPITPKESLDLAHRAGLRVIAICDHDTIDGAVEAQLIAEEKGSDVGVIIGEEVTTAQGHLLALNIKTVILSMLPLYETVRLVHLQGGLAIVPHGGWGPSIASISEAAMEQVVAQGEYFDGLEILNPNFSAEHRDQARRKWYHFGGAGLGISDDHEGNVGRLAVTLFPGKTKEDLIKAILLAKTIPLQSKLPLLPVSLEKRFSRQTRSLTKGLSQKMRRLPILVSSLLVLHKEKRKN